MKIFGIFAVLVLLLFSSVAFADDTADEAEVSGDVEETEADADEASDETVVIQGGNEYPLLARALDRIKLVFTLQEERKLELITKIQQKRGDHYDFLVANGKTEQASRFKERTVGLEKNFDQWKSKKQEVIQRLESRAEKIKEKASAANAAGEAAQAE